MQDIVDRLASLAPIEWLVGPRRVKGQCPEQLAVLSDDADFGSGDEQSDFAVAMNGADGDVSEPSQVMEGAFDDCRNAGQLQLRDSNSSSRGGRQFGRSSSAGASLDHSG